MFKTEELLIPNHTRKKHLTHVSFGLYRIRSSVGILMEKNTPQTEKIKHIESIISFPLTWQ